MTSAMSGVASVPSLWTPQFDIATHKVELEELKEPKSD